METFDEITELKAQVDWLAEQCSILCATLDCDDCPHAVHCGEGWESYIVCNLFPLGDNFSDAWKQVAKKKTGK